MDKMVLAKRLSMEPWGSSSAVWCLKVCIVLGFLPSTCTQFGWHPLDWRMETVTEPSHRASVETSNPINLQDLFDVILSLIKGNYLCIPSHLSVVYFLPCVVSSGARRWHQSLAWSSGSSSLDFTVLLWLYSQPQTSGWAPVWWQPLLLWWAREMRVKGLTKNSPVLVGYITGLPNHDLTSKVLR